VKGSLLDQLCLVNVVRCDVAFLLFIHCLARTRAAPA
jgi:hypothetical protein